MSAQPATIAISKALGLIYCTKLSPPIKGAAAKSYHTSYSAALGFAVEFAVSFDRQIIDQTGRLSSDQLDQLCQGYALDQLPEVLAEIAALTGANASG